MNLDWNNLGFKYMRTNCHIRHVCCDGHWDDGELVTDEYMSMHIAATALHYGQAAFEGLKAFACKDGEIRVFRPNMNIKRMADTARRICMTPVPEDLYLSAIKRVTEANIEFVPPYGTGGSLYIRPLLFGSGPQIGVTPSREYTFLIMVLPVGAYYKGGLSPVRAIIYDDYDRTAPQGVGNVKVSGNYAAGMEAHEMAKTHGYDVELYLDAREHKYVDEFGTSNFIGITKDGTLITPDSQSVLPSVTNKCLQRIAKDLGIPVERRPVAYDELADLAEMGACGTAVVITPVNEITRGDTVIKVGSREGCGPILQKLYDRMTAIQNGDVEDPYGWTVKLSEL